MEIETHRACNGYHLTFQREKGVGDSVVSPWFGKNKVETKWAAAGERDLIENPAEKHPAPEPQCRGYNLKYSRARASA